MAAQVWYRQSIKIRYSTQNRSEMHQASPLHLALVNVKGFAGMDQGI